MLTGLIIYTLYGYRRGKEALKPKKSTEGDFIFFENPDVDASFKYIQPKRKRDKQQSGNWRICGKFKRRMGRVGRVRAGRAVIADLNRIW